MINRKTVFAMNIELQGEPIDDKTYEMETVHPFPSHYFTIEERVNILAAQLAKELSKTEYQYCKHDIKAEFSFTGEETIGRLKYPHVKE